MDLNNKNESIDDVVVSHQIKRNLLYLPISAVGATLGITFISCEIAKSPSTLYEYIGLAVIPITTILSFYSCIKSYKYISSEIDKKYSQFNTKK